ncbi:uncharacterized protein METZ01_LOCUS500605 [marine metagenome]|uniref:50S ribosomal protein L13 n=1 Tax=marine metagenome TaxID=408172 RepID=A0A383DTC1_9ZZZZ
MTETRLLLLWYAFLISAVKTTLAKKEELERNWFVVDASEKILGRMAVKIADVLRGRHKPIYTPHVDAGDFVVVVNAEKVALSGNKEEQKKYMFYSGYVGNEKYRSVADFRAKRPTFIIENAVKGMMPKNRLARQMLKKLKIYAGPEHPHEAQNPQPLELD